MLFKECYRSKGAAQKGLHKRGRMFLDLSDLWSYISSQWLGQGCIMCYNIPLYNIWITHIFINRSVVLDCVWFFETLLLYTFIVTFIVTLQFCSFILVLGVFLQISEWIKFQFNKVCYFFRTSGPIKLMNG